MKEITEKEKIKELFENIASEEKWNQNSLNKILRKFKKNDGQLYRNDELVKMFVIVKKDFSKKNISLIEKRIRLKPTRTNSGVSVVTVMMMPYYCPGNCIFCPNDRSMPKSYIAS
ncbi:MAG TPA: hypothetical protein PLR64_04120, partial [Candidatus Dojkabacteria bacterium]|nr:hypothetical protein [Candidatus Dojkabacteria bacterium]